MDTAPDLSLVVLSWNTRQLLSECLESILAGSGNLECEIIVIDNASSDGSAEMVAKDFPEARLIRNRENLGYAAGVNVGLKASHGEKICLLGSDTRVFPDALPKLAAFLDDHPQAGAVAPRILNPDGSVQHGCMRFPSLSTVLWWDTPLQLWWPESRELRRYEMRDWDHRGTRQIEQPPGTCLMIPRRTLDRVGLMDERLWLFFNDVDWALRIWKTKAPIWYLDDAQVYHHLGQSTAQFDGKATQWYGNRISFYRKHFHTVGVASTKAALLYIAIRECWRTWRHVPINRESIAHVKMVFRTVGGVILRH